MDLDDADHPTRRRRGILIVLSSPSGHGRNTSPDFARTHTDSHWLPENRLDLGAEGLLHLG